MRIPTGNLSELGIVKDIRDNMLPANAWTAGYNVRFYDGKVGTARGGVKTMDPPMLTPLWLLYTVAPNLTDTWIAAGPQTVSAWQSGTWFDITRTTGGVYNPTKWNGGNLAGIPILNNGADMPQYWGSIAQGTHLADLSNWPTTWRCNVMRPYLSFLVALNVVEQGTRYLHRFRWSHPAQPGGIPVSWDDTDPTKQAGIDELTDVHNGQIIDGLPLRDIFIIYKQRATWGMKFTGGQYVMDVYPIFQSTGALSQDCVCNFGEPAQHFVFTGEDLIVHDGQQRQSVADKKLRRWILNNIDSANWQNSYVVPYADQNEIWTCIPTSGNIYPNLAIVWNIIDGSFGYRNLKNAAYITVGVDLSITLGPTWSSAAGSWDAYTGRWSDGEASAYSRSLLQADPVDDAIIHLDTTQQYLGNNYDCQIERTGLALAGVANDGSPLSNKDVRKLVRGLWISAAGNQFTVQVGRQHEIEDALVWGTALIFTPGTDIYIGVMDDTDDQACRLFGLRFSWTNQNQGEINSIDVDVEPLGEW
jgi:hypothetical protein